MGWGWEDVSFLVSFLFFLCLCSLSIQVLEYVGFVFYCMSLLGDWTMTFHCNLMDMVHTTSGSSSFVAPPPPLMLLGPR